MPVKFVNGLDICGDTDCLIRTCSRHRCQFKRSRRWQINWSSYKNTCGMYKSKNQWRTFYTPPPREDELEDERTDSDRETGSEDSRDNEGDAGGVGRSSGEA